MNRRSLLQMLPMIATAPTLALPQPHRPDLGGLGGLRFTDKEMEIIFNGFQFSDPENCHDPESVRNHVQALQLIWCKLLNLADFHSPAIREMTAMIEDYDELYAMHYIDHELVEHDEFLMEKIEIEATKLRELVELTARVNRCSFKAEG